MPSGPATTHRPPVGRRAAPDRIVVRRDPLPLTGDPDAAQPRASARRAHVR